MHKKYHHRVNSVVAHPKECTHIGTIRQWCIEEFTQGNVVIMDDNLKFQVRQHPGDYPEHDTKFPLQPMISLHFKPETIERIQHNMFNWFVDNLNLNKHGIVAMSARTGNHTFKEEVSYCRRFYGFWGVNKQLYRQSQIKHYADYPTKEDFCIGLEFLTTGVPIIITNTYAFEKSGANTQGGCSTYRTLEVERQQTLKLKRQFPHFVTVTEKASKSWGGDLSNTRFDALIHWQRAYDYGLYKTKQKQTNGLF